MAAGGCKKLKRRVNPRPGYVKEALEAGGLESAYGSRLPYQWNDYIGWITRAKTEKTKQKRLNQMLDELRDGTLYMKMLWKPKNASRSKGDAR